VAAAEHPLCATAMQRLLAEEHGQAEPFGPVWMDRESGKRMIGGV
jgi:hypothetical protein